MTEERIVHDGWGWIESRWIVIDGAKRQDFTVEHRLYSAVELKTLLLESGFHQVDVFGSIDGAPYDQDAKRLVLFALKKG